MLTIVDVPPEIQALYNESKTLGTKIMKSLGEGRTPVTMDPQTDLVSAHKASIVCIRSGMFRYFFEGKLIRLYSAGDILMTHENPVRGKSIICELLAEAIVIPRPDFLQSISHDSALLQQWLSYRQKVDTISHALCSLYVPEDFKPDVAMKQYAPGDVIIREGDSPDDLFEMIEGSASVSVGETQIGVVNEGEVFGEVSFLTGSRRCATVTAQGQCLVQVIRGADFEKIVKYRPALMYSLSKTLARRLTEVNDRLIKITSLIMT